MTSNCHPRSRCRASWDPRAPRAAERAGSFGPLRIHVRCIASGWCCSGGQVLAQRWRHIARSTLETETLAQPDRGRSQGAECGDIDRLAVHHARLEHLCLHGCGREATNQSELDLRAAIEAAHVGDESVNQIAKAARRGRTAIEARQQVLVVRHRGTSARRELSRGRRYGLDNRTISGHPWKLMLFMSISLAEPGQSCQKFLKRVGASSV